ncbi:hypothetical protein [Streptomyces vietnamensis]|uniref:Uncharacterized protein n=1 Tax=Streptomyces vietnamensis TaxID=362257 RepID=A0A0B5HZN3_9ACTN|nr:hypothetical protein [Streptomyces vietnamensis]AJF63717.1 hypothetical protein SVTN_03845 [Streptomyces vietnamensis]
MSGLAAVLDALRRDERRLTTELLALAGRHRQEHEIHHVATDLARWSAEHDRLLRETLHHYGPADTAPPSSDPPDTAPPPAGPRETGAPPAGPREAGPMTDDAPPDLLEDLRALHLAVAGNCVYWQMLAQAAAATRDSRLTELVEHCEPQAQRQLRWTESMIKSLAAQLLTAS